MPKQKNERTQGRRRFGTSQRGTVTPISRELVRALNTGGRIRGNTIRRRQQNVNRSRGRLQGMSQSGIRTVHARVLGQNLPLLGAGILNSGLRVRNEDESAGMDTFRAPVAHPPHIELKKRRAEHYKKILVEEPNLHWAWELDLKQERQALKDEVRQKAEDWVSATNLIFYPPNTANIGHGGEIFDNFEVYEQRRIARRRHH